MKRTIVSIAVSILFIGIGSSVAWSATGGPGGSIRLGADTDTDVGLSAGVYAAYTATDSAYGVGTVHKQGNKNFAASSASSQIYYKKVGVGKSSAESVSAGNTIWGGWTEVGKE